MTEKITHWSYSSSKDIFRKGVDYAAAVKLGIVEKSYGKAVDIGKFVHAVLLGGEQDFVVSPYNDFRTKEAREWKAQQTKTILNEAEFETIVKIVDRIKSHKLAFELLCGKDVENEVKLTGKINGKDWIGYADALKVGEGKTFEYAADLKTTAQFDDFKRQASRNDLDLQDVVYKLLADIGDKPFYWIIAETIPPFRVGVAMASQEFEESGYRKLQTICERIQEFDARPGQNDLEKLNFNQNETLDDLLLIGDWSL